MKTRGPKAEKKEGDVGDSSGAAIARRPTTPTKQNRRLKFEYSKQSNLGCFICGNYDIASTSLSRRIYSKKVIEFKSVLGKLHHATEPSGWREDVHESCGKCLEAIKKVLDFHQQIETIKKDLIRIASKCLETMKERGDFSRLDNQADLDDLPDCVDVVVKEDVITNLSDDGKEPDSTAKMSSPTRGRLPRKSKVKAEAIIRSVTRIEVQVPKSSMKRGKKPRPGNADNDFPGDSDAEILRQTQESDSKEIITTPKKNKRRKVSNAEVKQDEQFFCKVCVRHFANARSLRNHSLRVHQQSLNYGCDSCPKKFFSQSELKAHTMSFHNPEAFRCSSCGKKLSSRRNLAIHEVIICNVQWEDYELERLRLKVQQCGIQGCAKKFAKETEFKRHSKTHLPDRPFACPTCGKTFKQKLSMDLHCNMICGSDKELDIQVRARRSISAKKPKPHRCPFCPKRFITTRMLRYHQEEKNHFSKDSVTAICYLCGAQMLEVSLTSHIRRMHEQNFSMFCPIPTCKKGFLTPGELKTHELRVHTKVTKGKPIKKYKCVICTKVFADKSTLATHKARIHLTAKPKFACSHCDFAFYSKQELGRHVKTHNRTGVDCSECGKHFDFKFRLKIHQERKLCWKKTKISRVSKMKQSGWCVKCNKVVARNRWLLKRHCRALHPKYEKEKVVVENTMMIEEERLKTVELFIVPDLQAELEGRSSKQEHTIIAVGSMQ